MKKFFLDNLPPILLTFVMISVLVISLVYLQILKQRAESKFVEDVFFSSCVKSDSDIEHRRTCGRAAKAYANGKADYVAYGKTVTWDEEARLYVIKGEK